MTDPIADLLNRIRNAVNARQKKTVVPYSNIKIAILDVMKNHQFIYDYKIVKNGAFQEIEVEFKPDLKSFHLKRVSKPGRRVYVKKTDIKPVIHGYGFSIFSTPSGVMTGDEAVKKGVGGEYLCEVW